MAILSVKEDWRDMEASVGHEEASTTRKFTVQFDTADNPVARPIMAVTATDGTTTIPRIWESHPNQPWLFVRDIRPRIIGPLFYEVVVSYATLPLTKRDEPYDPTGNPLAQPWEVEWGFNVSDEQIDRAIDESGDKTIPIMNSAQEMFDPPISIPISDLVLRVQRNEAGYNPIFALSYKDTINIDWWLGFAPEQVKCMDFSARRARVADLFYWQVNYEFHIRYDNWRLRVLDAGYHEKDAITKNFKTIQITDPDDTAIPRTKKVAPRNPWPLDGQGHALTEAYVYDFNPLHWREFKVYRQMPFSMLGF